MHAMQQQDLTFINVSRYFIANFFPIAVEILVLETNFEELMTALKGKLQ